jgi:hypothetical protein
VSFISYENPGVLLWVHKTDDPHSNGFSVFGRYVVINDGQNRLKLYDIFAANQPIEPIPYGLPQVDPDGVGIGATQGGVAMAKLANGDYLVVAAGDLGQGGQDDFFLVTGDPAAPTKKYYLGRSHAGDTVPDEDYWDSQNLQLITECETGDIYLVHSSGADNPSDGYFRLSRLDPWTVKQQTIFIYETPDDINSCNARSGASAFVQPDGNISLYCHERATDSDYFNYQVNSR